MKSFDELVEIYDNALKLAKAKLPNPESYPEHIIEVPVIIETEIPMRLHYEALIEHALFPNMIRFQFWKHRNEWVLNAH